MSTSLNDLFSELDRSRRRHQEIIDEMKPLIEELGDDSQPNSRIPQLENKLDTLAKKVEEESGIIYDSIMEIIKRTRER